MRTRDKERILIDDRRIEEAQAELNLAAVKFVLTRDTRSDPESDDLTDCVWDLLRCWRDSKTPIDNRITVLLREEWEYLKERVSRGLTHE